MKECALRSLSEVGLLFFLFLNFVIMKAKHSGNSAAI